MKKDKQLLNAESIIDCIAGNGTVTQIQVEKQIHLKRTSVFNIFEELKNAGLIVSPSSSMAVQKGRPRSLWTLNPQVAAFMMIYINSKHNYFVLTDFNGNQIFSETGQFSENIDDAIACIAEKYREWHAKYKIAGIMIAISAKTDFERGEIIASSIWKLKGFPLKEKLLETLGIDEEDQLLLVENNARLGAWGEFCFGSSIGTRNLLTLHIYQGRRNGRNIFIGLGSGIILDGRLFRGFRGGAGELDRSCYDWFEKIYEKDKFPTALNELDQTSLKFFAEKLGEGFAHMVNYLAPQRMVVVFDHENVSMEFIQILRQSVKKNLIIPEADFFPIEISTEGVNFVLKGGAALLRQIFFNRSEPLSRLLCQALQSSK
ncbi:MAG: ROK family protein [Lentisphaerota bacterium]